MLQFLALLPIAALFLVGFAGAVIFRKGAVVRWPILAVMVVSIAGIFKLLISNSHQSVGKLVLYNLLPLMALVWFARIPAVSRVLLRMAQTIMAAREAAERHRVEKARKI